MKEQILILEDDNDLNRGLKTALIEDGKSVISVGTIKDFKEQLSVSTPSLVLMDINLPDGSGLDMLSEIAGKMPVIMISANDTDEDVVRGLEMGADDYITKPFSLKVLRARVNARLKRADNADKIYSKGDYSFDFTNMKFQKGSMTIELSKTEQKILNILVANEGATVRRSMLIDKVWTDGSEYVDENALSVSVKRLRDKLDARNEIRTVYGIGYIWSVS